MIYSEKDKFMVAINCDSSDIIPYVTIIHKAFHISYTDENNNFGKNRNKFSKGCIKNIKRSKELK